MSLLLAFLPFALVCGFTPGPNNFMLAASGANYGYRRTLPHIAGVVIGFSFLAGVVGMGLGSVLARFPFFHMALKYAGAAFLLYLAWRIATAGPHGDAAAERNRGRPLTFFEAVLFQWVNPKAWLIIISAVATYTSAGGNTMVEVGILVIGLLIAATLSANAWAVLGLGVNRLFGNNPRAMRIFNIVMAVLLVASVLPFLA